MEIEALLAIGMFLTAIIALLAGYPVAFTLGGVACSARPRAISTCFSSASCPTASSVPWKTRC